MEFSFHFWLGFFIFVAIALILDLGVLNRHSKTISFKQASNMTAIWVLLASIFCTFIYYVSNKQKALEFITGYIVELSLSMDNVFVFVLIFSYFKIPQQHQHRVLFWGIIGAILMRFVMITGGVYLVHYFEWLFYIFGIILIVSGIKIAISKDEQDDIDLEKNWIVRFLKKYSRFTTKLHDEKFIVKQKGVFYFTPLFLVLIFTEKADLIFALDSIPAILAISKDTFIIFTSNIFAILGLRSLYFLLANIIDKFGYLKYGIAAILVFIGFKMILAETGFQISVLYSLLFILIALTSSIVLSIFLIKDNKSKSKS